MVCRVDAKAHPGRRAGATLVTLGDDIEIRFETVVNVDQPDQPDCNNISVDIQ